LTNIHQFIMRSDDQSDVGKASDGADHGSAVSAKDEQRWLAYERTHLANERTYAAWLRTGLSVAAVGIAIAHLLPEEARRPVLSLSLGTGFVITGVVLIAFGAWRYGRTHQALSAAAERARLVSPGVVYVVTAFVAALLLSALVMV
jgi:putative membrane protein